MSRYHRIHDTVILFAAAEAVWAAELVRLFGPEADTVYRDRPEARGEPGSLLRDAWLAREHACAAWREARELEVAKDDRSAAA